MSFLRFSLRAMLGWLACAVSAASAAVTISDVHVTNIGSTTFTVVWTTSEVSRPALDVFTDAAGTQSITASVGLEFYPVAEGDPAVVNDALARASRRALIALASNRRVVSVRVTGLQPGTTYHVRPRSLATNGSDNGAPGLALTPATTAQFSTFITEARLLRIQIPTFAAEGMVLLVQGPAGTTPLSAIVGDSAAGDVALFSTAQVIDTTTGTQALFTTPQPFLIKAIGAGAPTATFTQTIAFSGNFGAAVSEPIVANIESPAPLITSHPTSRTVAAGTPVTFTVAATGTPAPTFHWQRRPAGSETWTDLANNATYAGVNTATLALAAPTAAMSGDQFRARVTNGVPPDAFSDPATLTVTASAVPPSITTPPVAAAVIAGSPASFTVVATGTPAPTYQWQRRAANAVGWVDLSETATYSGVTTATLAVANTTLAMSGDHFRVIVSNGVQPNATSTGVALTVTAGATAPTFLTHPIARTGAVGADVTFTVSASGTPTPTLTWQIKLAGTAAWLDIGATPGYLGADTATLTVKSVTLAMSGDQFRALAANGTLPNATSEAATLTVLTPPSITTPPQPVIIAALGTAQFTVVASGNGELGYRWQRLPVGTTTWADLEENATYRGVTTSALAVHGVLPAMNGDLFRVIVSDTVGSTTSAAASLTVTKAAATIALSKLQAIYDGTAKVPTAVTTPAGLNVVMTYNGSPTAPIYPGTYLVEARVEDASHAGTVAGELVIRAANIVRRAPTISGGVDGSLQVLTAESITLGGWIARDLLVPGVPVHAVAATATLGGLREASGSATPTAHQVSLTGTAALRYLVRRVDAPAIPAVPVPPLTTGTRNVVLSGPGQSVGDWATVRSLAVNGNSGEITVPPGNYASLAVNGTSTLVLGVAGSNEPSVYNLQMLSVNTLLGSARLLVVGPVIIQVSNTVTLMGATGNLEHPEWLTIRMSGGNFSANTAQGVHGYIVAPSSLVALNGRALLRGGVIADRLTIAVNAELEEVAP